MLSTASSQGKKEWPNLQSNMTRRTRNRAVLSALLCLAVTMLAAIIVAPAARAETGLAITSNGTTAGYLTLSWADSDASKPYKLQQQIDDGEWTTIYEGTDPGTTLTGLPDGSYKFRLNSSDPATVDDELWLDPLDVEIAHHSLTKALAFFGSGLVIFATLLWLLFFASPSTSNREA